MASKGDFQQRLPFFVYGTLCTGFLNWERFIQVSSSHSCWVDGLFRGLFVFFNELLTPSAAMESANSLRSSSRACCCRLPRQV